MELRHYDAQPIEVFDHNMLVIQPQVRSKYDKPRGLWVSVLGEDDWPSWCEAENFMLDQIKAEHVVTLHPDATILKLESAEELDEFTLKYGVPHTWGYGDKEYTDMVIDWPRVAAEYDGIIIAPYQWSRRLDMGREGVDTGWYYGWDCASGCIWNLNAIASVTHVPKAVTA